MARFVTALMLGLMFLVPMTASAGDGLDPSADVEQALYIRHSFQPVSIGDRPVASRPAILPALYVSFAGLQAYDAYATLKGVASGAKEGNPLLGGVASNPAAFWGIKAGVTTASIFASERLWRKHRRAEAIALMVATNSVMAAVAARNVSIVHGR